MHYQDSAAIKNHMQVVGSDRGILGTVDHLDANDTLKLTKDSQGQHHWIPLDWIAEVDKQVHLNRSSEQAGREWMTTPPPKGVRS